jgi:hypothetical protein
MHQTATLVSNGFETMRPEASAKDYVGGDRHLSQLASSDHGERTRH